MADVIWKDVVGYEHLYSVSNNGNIYSKITNKVLKQQLNKNNGYKMLILVDLKGGKKTFCVHRLVAFAFLECIPGKDMINHKDEIKTNNTPENLEWCTKKYNNTYNNKTDRSNKEIAQIGFMGEVLKIWKGAREASKELKIQYKNISACCRGKRNTCGGYGWKFTNKGEAR